MDLLLLVAGFLLLIKGADWFVDGAGGLAEKTGVSQLLIGLTIVAMGTSLPEASVSITASLEQSSGITIGNVVGSNILNIGIILGITSLISVLPVLRSTLRQEMPVLTGCNCALVLFGMDGILSRVEGFLLLAGFLFYLFHLFHLARQTSAQPVTHSSLSLFKCIMFIVIGLVSLLFGSTLAVSSARNIATWMHIPERIIGLTIVALGTSLPELLTSVSAARKKNADIAIGNIIGSNIFNILFVAGSSALLSPVPCEKKFLIDGVVMIAITLLLWLVMKKEKALTRKGGMALLFVYLLYFLWLCLQ